MALARLAPTLILEDATVPRSELAGMVRDVQRIAEEEGLLIAVFGHAGDGNLHPNVLVDLRDEDETRRTLAAAEEIFRLAIEMGGVLSGEHGIGILKRDYLTQAIGASERALLARIKAAFDPHGILNPGKAI